MSSYAQKAAKAAAPCGQIVPRMHIDRHAAERIGSSRDARYSRSAGDPKAPIGTVVYTVQYTSISVDHDFLSDEGSYNIDELLLLICDRKKHEAMGLCPLFFDMLTLHQQRWPAKVMNIRVDGLSKACSGEKHSTMRKEMLFVNNWKKGGKSAQEIVCTDCLPHMLHDRYLSAGNKIGMKKTYAVPLWHEMTALAFMRYIKCCVARFAKIQKPDDVFFNNAHFVMEKLSGKALPGAQCELIPSEIISFKPHHASVAESELCMTIMMNYLFYSAYFARLGVTSISIQIRQTSVRLILPLKIQFVHNEPFLASHGTIPIAWMNNPKSMSSPSNIFPQVTLSSEPSFSCKSLLNTKLVSVFEAIFTRVLVDQNFANVMNIGEMYQFNPTLHTSGSAPSMRDEILNDAWEFIHEGTFKTLGSSTGIMLADYRRDGRRSAGTDYSGTPYTFKHARTLTYLPKNI